MLLTSALPCRRSGMRIWRRSSRTVSLPSGETSCLPPPCTYEAGCSMQGWLQHARLLPVGRACARTAGHPFAAIVGRSGSYQVLGGGRLCLMCMPHVRAIVINTYSWSQGSLCSTFTPSPVWMCHVQIPARLIRHREHLLVSIKAVRQVHSRSPDIWSGTRGKRAHRKHAQYHIQADS